MRAGLLVTVLCPVLAAGCAPERCTADNDELSMVARAVDLLPETGEEVRVGVRFSLMGQSEIPVSWSMCDGDRVLINGEEAEEIEQENRTEYSVTLDGGATETVTIELDRASQDEVVAASVERPPRFVISGPQPGASLSRSEAVELSWAPPAPGGQMQIQLLEELGGGRCVVTAQPEQDYKGGGGVRVDDTGSWTIPAGTLTNDGDLRCDARYILSRFSRGEYPEQLAPEGFIEAQVLRILLFESVP